MFSSPLSRLRLLSPIPSPTNAIVRWESVSGRKYFVQRGANLNAQPTFLTVATNVADPKPDPPKPVDPQPEPPRQPQFEELVLPASSVARTTK